MGGSAAGSSRKITLPTLAKSNDARQEFILDYVKLCTLADIPLEKTEKIQLFLRNTVHRLMFCLKLIYSIPLMFPGFL